jgi:hypothetical protein
VRPQLGCEFLELPDDVFGVLPGKSGKYFTTFAVFTVAGRASHHSIHRDALRVNDAALRYEFGVA